MTLSTTFDIVERSDGTVRDLSTTLEAARLQEACMHLASQLRALGAVPGQPVCYIPPTGAGGAVAFLGISMVAASAPVHPGLTTAEVSAYIHSLEPTHVIVPHGRRSELAGAVDCPVLSWSPDGLSIQDSSATGTVCAPAAADVALVLPTSGTTGQPKQVPLTHAQLCASAGNIANWLQLDNADVSLTMMPLFHIHGLVAGLLAPLSAAGTVCAQPFDAFGFQKFLDAFRPTWFSAVPTMHALLVDRWGPRRDQLTIEQLRFVRSSSSPLSPDLLHSVESVFGVPSAEAYGMTEASHQIAANPIGPGERRPGTVGVATGTELRIENPDELGRGEVLVRAPQVTHGYRNRPEANNEAFTDGWFRTGDEGFLDDGWLSLTGRMKEMINRGGEKVSPIEVEVELARIRGVARCVAFATPHSKLGEDVTAAVVVAEDGGFDAEGCRSTLRSTLAAHKVPRNILVVDEIPLGPTGKVQRSRLADQLGL